MTNAGTGAEITKLIPEELRGKLCHSDLYVFVDVFFYNNHCAIGIVMQSDSEQYTTTKMLKENVQNQTEAEFLGIIYALENLKGGHLHRKPGQDTVLFTNSWPTISSIQEGDINSTKIIIPKKNLYSDLVKSLRENAGRMSNGVHFVHASRNSSEHLSLAHELAHKAVDEHFQKASPKISILFERGPLARQSTWAFIPSNDKKRRKFI